MGALIEHISGTVELYDYDAGTWFTVCELSDDNVVSASCRRQCCPTGAFTIGGVYAATLSMMCVLPLNYFQVKRARFRVKSQYTGESEPADIGTFWVTNAERVGKLYTISAQDAVGWLDTSSVNEPSRRRHITRGLSLYTRAFVGSLHDWLSKELIPLSNSFIQGATGIPNMLTWKNYERNYCNQHTWIKIDNKVRESSYISTFKIYEENGLSQTDSVRECCRWVAELACGFVYALENGDLTLGQFASDEYGTAEIETSDIEMDSCEIADFTLCRNLIIVKFESDEYEDAVCYDYFPYEGRNYSDTAYFNITVSSNPLLDGAAIMNMVNGGWNDLLTIVYGILNVFHDYPAVADLTVPRTELQEHPRFTIRPFHCTVHKAARFHLGQKIHIKYKGYGDTEDQEYNSIITGITWTFRGGQKLECGGADSRVMADCMKISKADKAIKEIRNRLVKN